MARKAALFKVYGVPLSPPFRSVVWTLLQKRTPFQIQITVPGATNKMGSRHESFLSLTRGRTGVVPLLQIQDEDRKVVANISESPAILTHLCETQPGWQEELYAAPGTLEKAQIDAYLHWHHTNTRRIAALTMPYTRPELNQSATTSQQEEAQERAAAVLSQLDRAWLGRDGDGNSYLALPDRYTIADVLAYEEIAQAALTGVVDISESDYPNLAAWCRRLEQRDFYQEAHQALRSLGSLTSNDDTAPPPMMKRLGAATKDGMKAIQEAQASYSK